MPNIVIINLLEGLHVLVKSCECQVLFGNHGQQQFLVLFTFKVTNVFPGINYLRGFKLVTFSPSQKHLSVLLPGKINDVGITAGFFQIGKTPRIDDLPLVNDGGRIHEKV